MARTLVTTALGKGIFAYDGASVCIAKRMRVGQSGNAYPVFAKFAEFLAAEGGTKLFGSSEYVIGDANTAMSTQNSLLRNYAANAPNPGIDIVEGLTQNAHIDTVSGRISLSSDLVQNYPNLIDGTVTEELFHFQQLQANGLLGCSVTAAQAQTMESEVVNLMLNSGFKTFP